MAGRNADEPDHLSFDRDSWPRIGVNLWWALAAGIAILSAMGTLRLRTVFMAGVLVVVIWFVATGGFILSRQSEMTVQELSSYVKATPLSDLEGEARAEAIQGLADRINAMSLEDRRIVRMRRKWEPWFLQMSEAEKTYFVEAIMPTGIKQMMVDFEAKPEERRKQIIDEALKRLRTAHELPDHPFKRISKIYTNAPPAISPELERRMKTIGLKTFYAESSAQTKVEATPLLEEIQKLMENGTVLR